MDRTSYDLPVETPDRIRVIEAQLLVWPLESLRGRIVDVDNAGPIKPRTAVAIRQGRTTRTRPAERCKPICRDRVEPMLVERFTDEYELVAPMYGTSPAELRDRDERSGQETQRWFVVDDGRAIAAATAWLRPDDRMFLTLRMPDTRACGPLTDTIVNALDRPVSTMCDDAQIEHLVALQDAGFAIEMTNDRFVIPFDEVLPRLQRAWLPGGYSIRSVADVDEDRAFRLDNAVRDLVPGSDGWRGNRERFAEELRSPEFDPTAYLVAIEEDSGSYVGLLRIWRNTDGPRLGLVAVLPQHRVRSLAAALLQRGLGSASQWGFDTFTTETSPQNPGTYPALMRMSLEPVGRFHQLTRRA